MNMKPMQKTAIKPIPAAKNFNTLEKSSLLTRIFGFESQKVVNSLRAENQELILMNQRNMESIKSLSDQLAESLSFQQNHIQTISEQLKAIENLPAKQEALQEKITNGESKTQIAKEFNISRETLYQYLRANNVA